MGELAASRIVKEQPEQSIRTVTVESDEVAAPA